MPDDGFINIGPQQGPYSQGEDEFDQTIPIGAATHLRICGCHTPKADNMVRLLSREKPKSQTEGHMGYVFLTLVLALAGCFYGFLYLFKQLSDLKSIVALLLACFGWGVLSSMFLQIRAFEEQRNRLFWETTLILLVCVMATYWAFHTRFIQFPVVTPVLVKEGYLIGGALYGRELLVLMVGLWLGMLCGWSFGIKSAPTAKELGFLEYSEFVPELQDPCKLHSRHSYNDAILRSDLQLLHANRGDRSHCLLCESTPEDLLLKDPEKVWLQYIVPCPNCNDHYCLRHYVNSAWKCRSCGELLSTALRNCGDCSPQDRPEGRVLLCPYCHGWKGCYDHYRKRGWKCPTCKKDLHAFLEMYANVNK